MSHAYQKKDQIVHNESTLEALTVRGRTNPEDFEGEGDLTQNLEENHQTGDILQKMSVPFVTKRGTGRKIVQSRAIRKKMNQL